MKNIKRSTRGFEPFRTLLTSTVFFLGCYAAHPIVAPSILNDTGIDLSILKGRQHHAAILPGDWFLRGHVPEHAFRAL